jgi:hypothetical protein
MRIGCTLLCKNEIDLIDQWLRHHSPMFDILYISDNVSSDGTWERILQWPSILHRQIESQDYCQKDWVYEVDADLRVRGCGWVANLDADEFLEGDVRAACAEADKAGVEQLYAHGTFMRATKIDPQYEDPLQRITWHDPWTLKYSNDKAILHTSGLTGVCQGCHWGYWDHPVKSQLTDTLLLRHYEQRSPEQLIKKYSGYPSPTKLKNMGEGWVRMNGLWKAGGDDALIKYWEEHCVYNIEGLEQGGLHA